ncbi:MAG: DUF86 domain-containing protein [Deltaproteobacteria bacterium]|nr:DUF86 domain-containing protein [Deltaproteobacteria bacterium]
MPGRDWKFRIEDIIEAVREILELTRGQTFESFCKDTKTTKAVLYNLAVIGEAARRLPAEVSSRYPALPWREMGDMRNVVIHEYFGIDLRILWETIQADLPPLLRPLREILSEG